MHRLSGREPDYDSQTSEAVQRLEIGRLVQARLGESRDPALRGLSCAERGGVLYLGGRPPGHHLKQVALALAFEVAGTLLIVNEIEVVAPLRRDTTGP